MHSVIFIKEVFVNPLEPNGTSWLTEPARARWRSDVGLDGQ
jgi:hypothetical protein